MQIREAKSLKVLREQIVQILADKWQTELETARTALLSNGGKLGGLIGGLIGGKAKVKKGFAVSGKQTANNRNGGRKKIENPTPEQLKRRERYEKQIGKLAESAND